MPTPTFELPPQYDPHAVEGPLYQRWLDAGVFTARVDSPKPPYVIMIPPPNVTGVLHIGHALNDTIQDVLIRCERMRGRETLWLPGTDHAGIATQNVVERQLAKEGKTRFDLGREKFVERVWSFIGETGPIILEQLKLIGCSCDWSRLRFTFDPAYTQVVREVFVRLWEEKLIYRGHRVIHWCPRCLTALSDEEAEFTEETGKLYYIRYPTPDGPEPYLTVATTRPETMLGDTAVAVNPDDPRHRAFIGKTARVPIANVTIPIIADEAVDPKFGTGFVKVTPAHDANDFEIGKRHNLEMPLVMREDGTMGDESGGQADRRTGGQVGAGATRPPDRPTAQRVPRDLIGVDRFTARERIVEELKQQGLLVKIEPHQHAVRHCYRCDTVVEPRLSDQWFVKMKPLAEPALKAYRDGTVRIVPERWGATYVNWMEGIRDWNISRQLWWGHRIPVFTCDKCGEQWAARTDPSACRKCGGPVTQDPDVLDTWFSSWLWPFATLGWPDKTPDLARFYPGNTLVTAPEILFFWVARMIMAGYHFMGQAPFSAVYLHGTARDTKHRRMSKSLGNGVDPLDVVRAFSADALRWTLIAGSSLGADVILDPDDLESTFAPGRNFANKLWNIGRFVLAQLPATVTPVDRLDRRTLRLAERWILSRLHETIGDVTKAFDEFRLDEGAKRCFDFVWHDLADRYVEEVKPRLAAGLGTGSPAPAAQRAPAVAGDPVPSPDGDKHGGEAGAPPGAAGARWAAAKGGAPASPEAAQAVLAYCMDVALRLLHPVVPFITEELWQKLPGRQPKDLLASAAWPVAAPALSFPEALKEFAIADAAVSGTRSTRADYNIPSGWVINGPLYLIPPSNEIRDVLNDSRDTIVTLARVSDVLVVATEPQNVGASATFVSHLGVKGILVLGDAVDVEKECKRLSGERERLDRQLTALVAKLSNENFVARAPAEVVAREREKEREWRVQRDVLDGKLKSLGCS